MFQIRIHGRGGQGVVTAAELLSLAAFDEGKHAQAFPSFGSERMGAPVMAFCRIHDGPIRLREPVSKPDALIVQDATLVTQVDLFSGLNPDGFLLVNTSRKLADLGLESLQGRLKAERIVSVPASELAMRYIGRPLPNIALLGAFCALTGVLRLESVIEAIGEKFSGHAAASNRDAARAAHDLVREITQGEGFRVEAN
ncbi:MAG: 2-oxoacid:acceptor oxidoreductase family protein [Bryobacteraceae bacterium]